MGVKGLWTVLESLGALEDAEIDVSELKNKILAVDVSIWLYQFVKSVPVGKDAALSPLVIGGLFQRVCKLLHFGIKPIFVFDGSAPNLKKETVALRQELRKKGQTDYSKLAKKILRSKLKLMALQQLEGDNDENPPILKNNPNTSKDIKDSFVPPIDLLAVLESSDYSDPEDVDYDDYSSVSSDIDTNSMDFKKLPYEIQEQILLESRKRTIDAAQINENGPDSPEAYKKAGGGALDFSKAQVEALIKRRKLMDELESLRGNTLKQSNISKSISHGTIASKSDKKFFFTKNVQAGWTLAYTDSQCIEEAVKDDAIISFKDNNNIKTEPEKSISDIEDEEEFMNLMFGDSNAKPQEEKTEFALEIKESSQSEFSDGESIEVKVEQSTIIKEIISEDEFTFDLPPRKNNSEKSELVEDVVETANFNSKDDENNRISLIDEKSTKLPDIILEGLIKRPSSDFIAYDKSYFENEAKFDGYSSDQEEVLEEYKSFIDQVTTDSSADKSSPEYKDLVDQLRSELREFNSLSEASALTSISPTKVLIDAFMEMLHNFHLPFIIAPFEAEAQCASIKGIDGIISDDSDCLLFGAEKVYRGFFGGSTKKRRGILKIESEKIFEKCGLSRNDLIVLSYLLGCDYCTGIDGIGPKRALELVKLVKSDEIVASLQKIVHLSENHEFKYQNWLKGKLPNNFIDMRVAQAFLNPIVNQTSVEDLQWRKFDQKSLERFMSVNAKWPIDKTCRFLQDVEKKTSRK